MGAQVAKASQSTQGKKDPAVEKKKDAKGQKPNQSEAEDTKQSEIKNHKHLKHRAAQVAKASQSIQGKKDPAVEKKMEKDVVVASAVNQKAAVAKEKAIRFKKAIKQYEHKTTIKKAAVADKAAKAGDVMILTPPNVKSKNVNQKRKQVEELNSSELGSDVAAIIGFD